MNSSLVFKHLKDDLLVNEVLNNYAWNNDIQVSKNLIEFYEEYTRNIHTSVMLAVASSDYQNTKNYYVISMEEIHCI